MVFVGSVLDLSGTSWPAVRHRMNQSMNVFLRWRPLLTAHWLPQKRRFALMASAVWASTTWCAQTWATTKAMRKALDSWSARMAAQVVQLRRLPDEDIGAWWRRMHRVGHQKIAQFLAPLSSMCLQMVHRWGGHVARLSPLHFTAAAMRCRGMQWWRWRQSQHTYAHPQRFRAWRWEEQLSRFHGDGFSSEVATNTGWLGLAQNRTAWRNAEHAFIASH